MMGATVKTLLLKKQKYTKKSDPWHNGALVMARIILKNNKKQSIKYHENFLSKKN